MHRLSLAALVLAACTKPPAPAEPLPSMMPPAPAPVALPFDSKPAPTTAAAPTRAHKAISRTDFNRVAVAQNLPVYWIADRDADGDLDATELAELLFYPPSSPMVLRGNFTPTFESAYDQIVAASQAKLDVTGEDGKRRALVMQDLDQGRPTLVATDTTKMTPAEVRFVHTMLAVATEIDATYELMNGAAAQAKQVPADLESQSLFRRNRGAKCAGPATENNPLCSAIPGAPRPVFDIYAPEVQAKEGFCKVLEKSKDKQVMDPFTVVRGTAAKPTAVPYTVAYQASFVRIATLLRTAAKELDARAEAPLVTYLGAAATSFETNDWAPADEAWAKMNVDNSRWYVRVAPDEVYWEPCAAKAGLHLTFAQINQGSRVWQQKLVPVQQEMESAIAALAGAPYKTHPVTFHLPDFIDLVINAGDDRDPLGATIGQSLPNWGAVANEGRGRTITMLNLYGDPDSMEARKQQAASVLDAASMESYEMAIEPGLLSTILHEVTHNLGPAHEYKVSGKTAGQVFGGQLASVMEELKAQTGALFLVEFLRSRQLITDAQAIATYTDSIVWAFGHISQGMYTGKDRKTYGNVAAMQIGFLLDKGALTWDATAVAGNGTDKGALHIHKDKLIPVIADMMKTVAGIKARGDKRAAETMAKRYVDGSKPVPHAAIQERFRRFPKPSFVYAISP